MSNKKTILHIIVGFLLYLISFICLKNNNIGSYIFVGIGIIICGYYIFKNQKQVLKHCKLGICLAILACILSPHHYWSENQVQWLEIGKTLIVAVISFIYSICFIDLLENNRESCKHGYNKWFSIIFYLLPLFVIGTEWIASYPAKLSTDSFVQLEQIQQNQYSDVHPAAHTLFCKALMQIYNSPAIVIFTQILCLSLITGYSFQYFYKKGISKNILLPILIIWSCLGPIRIVTCYFWKDVFFAIALLLLTLEFVKIIDKKEKTNILDLILAGIALIAITLFRHNGIIVFIFALIAFIYFACKYHKKMLVPISISLIGIVIVKTLVYSCFAVTPNNNGTKYALPAKAIISVVYYDGNYTQEELKKIEQLMSKEQIKLRYDAEIGQSLLWIKPSFGDSLEGKEKIIIELFIELFPKNVGIMVKDIMSSTYLMMKFQYDDKNKFVNPNIVTSMPRLVGDNYWVNHNMPYMFLLIICMIILIKHKKFESLIPFVPMLANVLSIVISNISYESRYAYPTIVCTAVLIVHTLYSIQKEKE